MCSTFLHLQELACMFIISCTILQEKFRYWIRKSYFLKINEKICTVQCSAVSLFPVQTNTIEWDLRTFLNSCFGSISCLFCLWPEQLLNTSLNIDHNNIHIYLSAGHDNNSCVHKSSADKGERPGISLITWHETIIWVNTVWVCVREKDVREKIARERETERENACRHRMNGTWKWVGGWVWWWWGEGGGGVQTQSRSKWTPSGYMKRSWCGGVGWVKQNKSTRAASM